MKNNNVIERIEKKIFNNSCPYCNSSDVHYTGLSLGAKSGGNSNQYPEAHAERWHCNHCNKKFELF